MQMTNVDLISSLVDTKLPVVWNVSNMEAGGSPAAVNNIFNGIKSDNLFPNSDLSQMFTKQWQYNFETILGPANPVFVDATLSDQDIAYGYRLEYNQNGILWRVNAAGIPHPDDLDNFIEQERVIESATNHTMEELQRDNKSSVVGSGGGSEADSERVKQIILERGSFNSSLSASGDLRAVKEVEKGISVIGPGTAINTAFSNAIYYDGSQKIPDGFRSIGGNNNPQTRFYAEFFTDDKQIVVVFRGTDSIKAIIESDSQLLLGKEVAQFADVRNTMIQLEEIVATNPELQGLPISATGHSLGGADAEYFTYISNGRYPSETFGAPGIINSLQAMNEDITGVNRLPVKNQVNIYDSVGTAELGGHVGVIKYYDMHPANVIPGWNDGALIEHSINTYQSYFDTV